MSAMRELCERGALRVIVTSGKEPALAFDGQRFWRIHAPKITAVNPIGSGDAFTAGLVWRLLRGADLGEACRWASAAGAANALTMMAGEVRRKDVLRLSAEVKVEEIDLPILGMEELADFVQSHHVKMAIVTVPAAVAQEVANSLVQCGVMGILNFAPIVLHVPEDVMVNNVNLAIELENLSYFIQQ